MKKMVGQRNMPQKIYALRENTSKDSDDHHWLLCDSPRDALDTACGPIYLGEYRLVRVIKVQEGEPKITAC